MRNEDSKNEYKILTESRRAMALKRNSCVPLEGNSDEYHEKNSYSRDTPGDSMDCVAKCSFLDNDVPPSPLHGSNPFTFEGPSTMGDYSSDNIADPLSTNAIPRKRSTVLQSLQSSDRPSFLNSLERFSTASASLDGFSSVEPMNAEQGSPKFSGHQRLPEPYAKKPMYDFPDASTSTGVANTKTIRIPQPTMTVSQREARLYGAPGWMHDFNNVNEEEFSDTDVDTLGYNRQDVEGRMVCIKEGSTDRVRRASTSKRQQRTFYLGDNAEATAAEEVGDLEKFWPRIAWLVTLLVIQSLVSIILQRFQGIVQHHPVVLYYLTMLIGTGGNAGSQSTVLVIRGLATGKCKPQDYFSVIFEQCRTGLALAVILTAVSFFRMFLFEGDGYEVLAVCVSMFVIVGTSVIMGTLLPIAFKLLRIDPAHAGAAIQVLMDMVGVTLTCLISHVILDRVVPALDPGYVARHALAESAARVST